MMEKAKRENLIIEIFNSASHGIGVIIGIVFLILMIFKFASIISASEFAGYIIYASCFIFMFLASTLYHGIQNEKAKGILRIFDHSAIFFFIAGSYTPIILTILEGKAKILFLSLIWTIAAIGFIFKLCTYGKYDKFKKLSVFIYVFMGWISIFMIKEILLKTSFTFLILIVSGGIIYTMGTYFYKKKLPLYNHIIWHFFVLAAAICHLVAIYNFLQ